ncbi:MAG: AAA family ATPase [Gemmataceae bacterium]|nr:AAA family ATPase [Gemmataceae bacterium]
MPQLIKDIRLRNLLSFGPNAEPLTLRQLNVLIGPNGSGKSNLIESIGLLRSVPAEIASTVRDGGGIRDWLWKGEKHPTARIEAVIEYPKGVTDLRHTLSFTEQGGRIELVDERIEDAEKTDPRAAQPRFYFGYQNRHPYLNVKEQKRSLQREDIDPEKSIVAQRKDPDQYPEITFLGREYERIRLFREWSFGRYTPARLPQKDSGSSRFLEDDCSNLGIVLNNLMGEPDVKAELLERVRELYDGIDDIHVEIQSGHVQVVLHEGKMKIPATRLSDGTLRYLCLLAILCHPHLPPLVCIEEPELGLHPDALVAVTSLLKEASRRSQFIVTTHSRIIVDALSETPEDVVVCDKIDGQTRMKRLDGEELKVWLGKYSLGELWRSGDLGGNRW